LEIRFLYNRAFPKYRLARGSAGSGKYISNMANINGLGRFRARKILIRENNLYNIFFGGNRPRGIQKSIFRFAKINTRPEIDFGQN